MTNHSPTGMTFPEESAYDENLDRRIDIRHAVEHHVWIVGAERQTTTSFVAIRGIRHYIILSHIVYLKVANTMAISQNLVDSALKPIWWNPVLHLITLLEWRIHISHPVKLIVMDGMTLN
jgi:hypothetical protein